MGKAGEGWKKSPRADLCKLHDATPAIAHSCCRLLSAWFWINIRREPLRASGKANQGRKYLEILLMFLALIGSFALVGLLVRFSENVIRPIAKMAAADHRHEEHE
jgi:hypothetical protein